VVHAEPDVGLSERNQRSLLFRSGRNMYRVSVEKALALAHSLMRATRFDAALQICQRVASLDVRDPQAAILLACCEANLKHYDACQNTLHAVYSGDTESLAEHLQAAFVYHNLGMNSDSAQELIALTDEAPDLPVGWLLLGDYLNDMGKQKKAMLCWRLAIDRDKQHGASRLAAEHELACVGHTRPSSPKS
jgi:tetratricopeptide (TPR) repeat protein